MIMYTVLVSLSVFLSLLYAIDPKERVGTCIKIKLNVSHYLNANEGVWFPQYRSRDDGYSEDDYSCHTVYEKVFIDEDDKPWLESSTYFVKNNITMKEPHVQVFYRSGTRGKLNSTTYIPDEGYYQIYNYVLDLRPDFRVRYVCSDFRRTIPGVQAVYIETRKLFPKIQTIMEARKSLERFNLSVPLVKIKQKKCVRPIEMDGYIPFDSHS